MQVRILGTSHISQDSADEIRELFDEFHPDAVAVELDRQRLKSLQERDRGVRQKVPAGMMRQVGPTGWLFMVIGSYIQRKLAGVVKVQPGIDMLTAVRLGHERGVPVLLVDQPIMRTLSRLRTQFTWREKLRLVWDVLTAPFQKEKLHIDLKSVPSKRVIRKLMRILRTRYPGLHKTLLTDRNAYMAVQLERYAEKNPDDRVLLVVGAGHEDDLKKRLVKVEGISIAS